MDYDTEEEAEECEKSHIKPVKVVKADYEYRVFKMPNTPVSVTVEFEDGMEREYVARGRG